MTKKRVAFVDLRSNNMSDKDRKRMADQYVKNYSKNINSFLDRLSELPPIMVKVGPHLDLLKEARVLYMHSYFYSCVAMCGITAERILKDIFANKILILDGKYAKRPPKKAMERLENFSAKNVTEFLLNSNLLHKSLKEPFKKLAELRNKYAHGGGLDLEKDAKAAVNYLHEIVDNTVSLFEKGKSTKKELK